MCVCVDVCLEAAGARGLQSGVQSHRRVRKTGSNSTMPIGRVLPLWKIPKVKKNWSWFVINAAGKPFPGTNIINSNTRLPAHVHWSKWSTQEAKGSFKCTMVSVALHGLCGRVLKQWILHGGSWLSLLSHRSRWQHKVHMTEGEIRLLTTAGTAESVRQTCS